MTEARCANEKCGHLLFKGRPNFRGTIEISCPRCQTLNLARGWDSVHVSVVAHSREGDYLGYTFGPPGGEDQKPAPRVVRRVKRPKGA
jgi:phage FluMu protein Com